MNLYSAVIRRLHIPPVRFLCLSAKAFGLTILFLPTMRCAAEFVSFRDETGATSAELQYGASGAGVTFVMMDRGIDWDHPDFIKPDGTTRIKWIYDMNPIHGAPLEISEAQINAALLGGTILNHRDAVGHGTASIGLAAGNGSAAFSGQFRGMAPEADLIVVKITSEGAPAHGTELAETPFNASYVDALDWVDGKVTQLGQPAVGVINAGTQWGPIDGTSPISRKIDEVFGANRPGRVFVAPSGDAGAADNHARATFDDQTDAVVGFDKLGTQTNYLQLYYSGNQPANITLEFDDGTTIGPVGPNVFVDQSGVRLINYLPGADAGEFQSSDGGDRLVWVEITGHATTGHLRISGLNPGTGTADLYTPIDGTLTTPIPFTDHLTPGRLADFAATESAIVAGAHVLLTEYTDVNGFARSAAGEGDPGQLWTGSSAGPTRDGRLQGIDVTAPGHNAFAAYAQESYWATLDFNEIENGGGWYGRHGATSGAAPIVAGAVALLLEAAPNATANDIRDLLRSSAVSDTETGVTPNVAWGAGKLNVAAALDLACSTGLASAGYCNLSADFDNDVDVDGRDFLVWQRGDSPNGINSGDLALWQSQYGTPFTATVTTVPEPSALMMVLFPLVAALGRRGKPRW